MPDLSLLGVFGGTFDPVHLGHLRLAEEAADLLGLASVRWIPAGQPRHRETPWVTAQHRLQMVGLAIADNPRFHCDPTEVTQEASYTVPTLERLRQEIGPAQPLVLLIGADAFATLNRWHRWRDLLTLAHIGIAHRPGFVLSATSLPPEVFTLYEQCYTTDPAALAAAPTGKLYPFAMTPLAISATQVRGLLAAELSVRYLLPQPIIDYIHTNQLYRKTNSSHNGS